MYRRLLALRKMSEPLRGPLYASRHDEPDNLLVYTRGDDEMTVILNFGGLASEVAVDDGAVVFSTHHPDREGEAVSGKVSVDALEGVIVDHR